MKMKSHERLLLLQAIVDLWVWIRPCVCVCVSPELREDITKNHADIVHYCDELNRELTQMLLQTICGGSDDC